MGRSDPPLGSLGEQREGMVMVMAMETGMEAEMGMGMIVRVRLVKDMPHSPSNQIK